MENINLKTYYMVIKILGDFVNNKIIDKDFFNENIIDVANEENSQKIYIGRIYYIAKKHNLVSIMAQAMENMGFESDSDVWKRWLKEKNRLIYKSVLMDVEREAIQEFFEKNNIWYMLLKGMVIRKYYPAP